MRRETERTIDAVTEMLRTLANRNRLRILYTLRETERSWTDLMFDLRINPKTLRDHLHCLMESKLVTEGNQKKFRLTEAGIAAMEMSIDNILSLADEAVKIVSNAPHSLKKRRSISKLRLHSVSTPSMNAK